MAANEASIFVAIGASGSKGLGDIKGLLKAFGGSFLAVVVLHRPSDTISILRGVLASNFDMPVVIANEARTGCSLLPS